MERRDLGPPGPKQGRILLIFFLAALIFSGPVELPAGRAPLEMDIKPGVSPAQVKYLNAAVNDVFKFFMENYHINLHKTMLLIAAPDEQAYASALMKDFKLPGPKAKEEANRTAGMARESKDYYILALKARASDSMASILKVTCHEMVHWYQLREGGQEKTGQHGWIMEGVANTIALHIVEGRLPGEFNKFRQNCLATLKTATTIPSFEKLDSRKDWHVAMGQYGGHVIYAKATVAVMELAQRAGIKSLFDYYRHLRHQTPAKAFRMAFKVNLQEFEKEMDQKFSK